MRKLKLFSLLAVLLCAASANVVFAEPTTINHVNYEFDENAKTAKVVGADYTWEDTDVSLVIPAQVEYNSQNYAVTAIGDNAFQGAEYLVSIELPEGLLSIGDAAFNQTSNLASINIPNSVTSVGEEAFAEAFKEDYPNGENAIDIVLGNGLTVLSKYMFSTAMMKSVTLQEGLLEIKQGVFQYCGYLTSITIPSTVTHIWGDEVDGDAFVSCKKLTDIYCYANPANLTWDDTNSDDFIASPAKTTRCHVKSCELAAFQTKFAHVNVTFVGDLPCAAPATPETSDNVDGIETAMAALIGAGTTDLTINRTLYKDGFFNTLCLPFSLNASELGASPLAGCQLYSLSDASYDGDKLDLTIAEESTIEAGMPYLIKWSYDSNITSMTFTGVTVTASTGSTVTKGTGNSQVRFVGTIGRSELPAGEENYLFLGSGDNLYYPASNDDTSMKGFRAYFIVNSETSGDVPRHAPARLVIAPKMPTAVDQVQGDNVQSTKVIENGQLFIIKNGVKYNAQGKVVK